MDILQKVISVSKSKVLHGPFENMLIDPKLISWGDGDILRKLLGVYEEELHDDLEETINRKPSRVINLGCAEGYYAVGMSKRLPEKEVIAIDTSATARYCTSVNSSLNVCNINVTETCPNPKIGDFWIIDIEGGETGFLSDSKNWFGVELVVELHEWTNRQMKDTFLSNFGHSHIIKIINQSGRNPNKFDFLLSYPDDIRWSSMSESRPESMRWMWMRPKD